MIKKDSLISLLILIEKKENKNVSIYRNIFLEKYNSYIKKMSKKWFKILKEYDKSITMHDTYLMGIESALKCIETYINGDRIKKDIKNKKFSFYMILKNYVNGYFQNYMKKMYRHNKKYKEISFSELSENELLKLQKIL